MGDNVSTIRRLETAWASDDYDTVREIIAPDFKNGGPGAEMMPPGLEGVIAGAQQAATDYFPDHRQELLDIFGEEDKVVARVRLTGTNNGKGLDWAGIPPNGNKVDVEWITVYTLQDGKVVETNGQMDIAKMMQQLGAMEG